VQDAKGTKLLFWSVPLVSVPCECWLALPLRSHPGCFWAAATALRVIHGLGWPREWLDRSPYPRCRGERGSASASAYAAAQCRYPRLLIKACDSDKLMLPFRPKLRFLLQVVTEGVWAKLPLPASPPHREHAYRAKLPCTSS